MGFLYGLAVALIWGAQPVVASFGYRASLTAFDLTMLRFAASGLLMLPLFFRRGAWNACGIGWPRALVLILLAGPLYNMALIGGLTWAPATHSSLIYPAFTPLFTAILARVMLDGNDRLPMLGLGMLIVGVLSIKLGAVLQPSGNAHPDAWRGDLLFMGAALMWSLYTVLMRRWNTEPLAVVSLVQVGSLLYVPVYLLMHGTAVFQLDPTAITIQVLYQGILVSVISVLLFNLAVRQLGAKASMFTALMPIVGVSLAVLLLGEPLTLSLVGGTLFIVSGLFLSLRKK
ncbi:DMT family transporter [Noviherbaspirillum cavernae]|uniref:DMT family transporter n=1 Tax=Noviherbaspirillum cavernae TaxID=2320862 RepID=A0A418X4Q7_9BURK|nr:DMT family transporter [Noviherbaspirillum cavernae]RJG07468.1 DMT family transporter [Noviherbaspirillum cavernae]